MKRWISALLLAVALVGVVTACTPDQMKTWWTNHGVSYAGKSDAEIKASADSATAYWNSRLSEDANLSKFDAVLSDPQLAQLRQCESGGNYAIVSSSGAYRGAYQFSRTTWNAVAGRHFPKYNGVDPAQAAPKVQDAMARALFSERGRSPWPVCGARI